MSILYHGSDVVVKEPLVNIGRHNLDFGVGFYLTRLHEQSQKWAKVVASRTPENKVGIISKYELDDTVFSASGVNFKHFDAYNMEWLDFVVECRKGNDITNYDIVEGGVANDQVIDTVEDYENGRITAQQALDQLSYQKPNNQICIRSQQLVDSFLKYIGEETVAL